MEIKNQPDLMHNFYIILAVLVSYLLGSIPTSIWLGRRYFGIDIRQYGSGNAGATNTFRVLGTTPGIIVMTIDIVKGLAGASIALFLLKIHMITPAQLTSYKLLLGIPCVLGHIFPVYEKFKGGKGVATLLGIVLSIHLEASIVCLSVFITVMFVSKYISLSSMLAALTFPLLFFIPHFKTSDPTLIIFGFSIFAVVILTHQKNIIRLMKGEEKKVNISIRRKNKSNVA